MRLLLCCRGQDLGASFEVQRLVHRNGESYRFFAQKVHYCSGIK